MGRYGLAVLLGTTVLSLRAPEPQPQVAALGQVDGVAVDAGSGEPISGSLVTFAGAGFRRVARTPRDGKFSFRAVPAGRYSLRASKPEFYGGGFGQRALSDSDKYLSLAAGQKLVATLRLWRNGAVTGRVAVEAGEPAVGLMVHALEFSDGAAGVALIRRAAGVTDDRGLYRITLPPGAYLVVVPGSTAQPRLRSERVDTWTFPPTFYPGVSEVRGAATLTVGSGQTIDRIDFTLGSATGVQVSGHVVVNGIREPLRVQLLQDDGTMLPAGLGNVDAVVSPDWTFRFRGVIPGSYIVRAVAQRPPIGAVTMKERSSNGIIFSGSIKPGEPLPAPPTTPMYWGELPVAVGRQDIMGISLDLQPGLVLSGTIRLDGSGSAPTPAQLNASPTALLPMTGDGVSAVSRIEADGRIRFQPITPGHYLLKVLLAFKGWAPERITMAGRDVTHGVLTLSASEDDLLIHLTDRPRASVAGRVTNSNGEPVPFASVFVFPADSSQWEFVGSGVYARAAGTDQDGRFTIDALLPAAYLLATREEHSPGWRRPDWLSELRRRATTILLVEDEHRNIDLVIRN